MKIIDHLLYLEYAEMLVCGIPQRTILSWETNIKDPADKRKILVPYDVLKDKYKALVNYKFGDPYEYVSKNPIKTLVKKDFEAEKFFLTYRFDNGKSLPPEYVQQYTMAASWLNMIAYSLDNKKVLKQQLNLTIQQFWNAVIELIKKDEIDLPTSDKRLRERLKEYQAESFKVLISAKFANRNSAKINTEVTEALLFELIAHPNQLDDSIIALMYNQKAVELHAETITPGTVGNYRRKHQYMLMQQREGKKVWADKFDKVIPGQRPTAPLLLLNSDDNNLDLFYIDVEDMTGNKFFKRMKMICVLDCFNDYVLGYAIGAEITKDLVRSAYLDAVYHVKELTGNWYLPHQIMSDRWGLKDLESFYTKLATFFPATVGLARAKYIERFFGGELKKVLKMYSNYNGNNISSKTEGVNREALVARKKDFPTLEEAPQQIAEVIHRLRTLPTQDATVNRQQQWLTAFNCSDKAKEKQISDEEMLFKLGIQHTHTNTINNTGLKISINNKQFLYEIPDIHYLQNVGKKVQVVYDPRNLTRVLVTDGGSLRFVATHHNLMPRAVADYMPGDKARLNGALQQKQQHNQLISDAAMQRPVVLRNAGIDSESLLKTGVMKKEIMHKAEEIFLIDDIDHTEETPSMWDKY